MWIPAPAAERRRDAETTWRVTPYSNIGAAHFLERHGSETYKRRLIANLERLGYAVKLEPVA